VCAAAVRDTGATGIVLLDDGSPECALAWDWLVAPLGSARVWRSAPAAGNVQGAAADALLAHPSNRTALLLGGRLPAVDLLPLGDVPASQVEALAGRWSGPPAVETLATLLGGAGTLDDALERLLERGTAAETPTAGLPADAAAELLRLWQAGRWWRLRHRLVPKLGPRTIGIDLFD
jgi:hypothetical protein